MKHSNLDLDIISDDVKALISKLHTPIKKSMPANRESVIEVLEDKKIQEDINRDSIALFPELEVAGEIGTTLILSPKEKVDHTLTMRIADNDMPNSFNMAVLNMITKYLEANYDLNDELYDITHRAYFKDGAVYKLIIPESALDDLISGKMTDDRSAMDALLKRSTESLVPRNIISNTAPSIESGETYLSGLLKPGFSLGKMETTDDFKILAARAALEEVRSDYILESISGAYDNYNLADKKVKKVYDSIYRTDTDIKHAEYLTLRNLNLRKTVGKPLNLDIDIKYVLPVHTPGNPKDHLGHYIIVSPESFIGADDTATANKDKVDEISSRTVNMFSNGEKRSEKNVISSVTKKLNRMVKEKEVLPDLVDIFSHHVESDLISKLTSGVYKNNVEIGDNSRFYMLMLYRMLNKLDTKILYVPVEMGQYFAINYHRNGTGKSVLESLSVITSLRAMLLLAKVKRQVASSIITTTVEVNIDEFDMDAENTRDLIMSELLKMQEDQLPIGETSLTNLSDWLVRQGLNIKFNEHPRLPNTTFDFTRDEVTLPDLSDDNDQDEKLRKQAILKTGIVPEMMDSGTDVDFASVSETSRQMVMKKFSRFRKILLTHETSYVQKLLIHDGTFKTMLKELILSEKSEIFKDIPDLKSLHKESEDLFLNETIKLVIFSLRATLPFPDSSTMTVLKEEYELYIEAVDAMLEIYYTEQLADSMQIESEILEYHKDATRGALLRKWCTTNGYLTEITDVLEKDSEGKFTQDMNDDTLAHLEDMAMAMYYFKKKKAKIADKALRAMEKIDEPEPMATDDTDGMDDAIDADSGMDAEAPEAPDLDADDTEETEDDTTDDDTTDDNADTENTDETTDENTDEETDDEGNDDVESDVKDFEVGEPPEATESIKPEDI